MKQIRIATTENMARYHHYAAVVEASEFEWAGIVSPPFDEHSLAGIDALIVSCDQHVPSRVAIAACKRLQIPTFHVLDGVIDWRTTFENPKFGLHEGGVPLFQPLLADHVFAMGSLQKWELGWFGNSQVQATGFPRFDRVERRNCRVGPPNSSARLVVATANTPWVTAEQKSRVLDEFRSLHRALLNASHEWKSIHVTYRIADSLAAALGVRVDRAGSARDALSGCDAVITTPSTFAIESMLAGVPTLIFDPFAFPIFTPSAWQAMSFETVVSLMPSLISPQQLRASYQDQVLELLVAPGQRAALRIREYINAIVHRQMPPDSVSPVLLEDRVSLRSLPPIWPERDWTLEQLASMEATIPALDKTNARLQGELQRLHEAHLRPTARFVAGTVARYFSNVFQFSRR